MRRKTLENPLKALLTLYSFFALIVKKQGIFSRLRPEGLAWNPGDPSKAFCNKCCKAKICWLEHSQLRDPWRASKSFSINVAKQGIFARCRACPETPLKLLAINVAKQGFVGWCRVRPGDPGDPLESLMQKVWQSKDLWVTFLVVVRPARRPWRFLWKLYAVSVAKQGIWMTFFGCCRACQETLEIPLKALCSKCGKARTLNYFFWLL